MSILGDEYITFVGTIPEGDWQMAWFGDDLIFVCPTHPPMRLVRQDSGENTIEPIVLQ